MRRIRNLATFGIIALTLVGGAAWILRAQLAPFLGVNVDAGIGGEARLDVPAGYRATTFASGLASPRFMAVSPSGTLFVAERGADRVIALPDADADGVADEIVAIGSDYGSANDLTFADDGTLLVAGQEALWEIALDGLTESTRRTITTELPATGSHTSKSLVLLPDGRVLLSIGSSCNVCAEEDGRRATVQVVSGDGELRPFMVGLRNAVGLWVDPETGRAWATNMGRDLLGDHEPPETLYELQEGADAGWPRCHAGRLPDPEFGDEEACDGVALPAATFPAHTAPLDLVGWEGHLVVALHGSWNSSVKVGYALWWIPWNGEPVGAPEPLATGFLPADREDALGRPAGLAVGPDGALYVSDDKAGFIYRIARDD